MKIRDQKEQRLQALVQRHEADDSKKAAHDKVTRLPAFLCTPQRPWLYLHDILGFFQFISAHTFFPRRQRPVLLTAHCMASWSYSGTTVYKRDRTPSQPH